MEEAKVALAQAVSGLAARTAKPATEPTPAPASPAPEGTETVVAVDAEKAVEQLRDYSALHNINLSFSVHKATGRTVIRVIDAETDKVVREIPPEEILNLAVSIEKMAGTLLHKKA